MLDKLISFDVKNSLWKFIQALLMYLVYRPQCVYMKVILQWSIVLKDQNTHGV